MFEKEHLLNPVAQQHYKFVLSELSHLSKKSKILDAGCGEGILTRKFSNRGFDVFACDISKNALLENSIHFKQVDLNMKLPYKNNSFDVIVCLEVIEHLENPWLLIGEFYRLLKNGGRLIISSPNISNCVARIYYLFSGKIWLFREHKTDHINPISYWEIESIIKKIGFKNTTLLEGVSVIDDVDIVTNIKNPFIKIIYCFIFMSWNLIHDIINRDNLKSRILFKSFSYVVKAKK